VKDFDEIPIWSCIVIAHMYFIAGYPKMGFLHVGLAVLFGVGDYVVGRRRK
jgi:hypothetical protein